MAAERDRRHEKKERGHEVCPTCQREVKGIKDYPAIAILEFAQLDLPEKITNDWHRTDVTELVKTAANSPEVKAYEDFLIENVGKFWAEMLSLR